MDRDRAIEVCLAIEKHLDRMSEGMISSLDLPFAYSVGGTVQVKFRGVPPIRLEDEDALAYLAWLDAGNLGDVDAWRAATSPAEGAL